MVSLNKDEYLYGIIIGGPTYEFYFYEPLYNN